MNWDSLISSVALLVGFFVIFLIGKLVHDIMHREYKLNYELVERDNPALALSVVGYYIGLVLTVGGAVVGPAGHLYDDLISLGIYGILGIVLLNISWIICDKVILKNFKVSDELIRDQNQGTGAVVGGVSIANGFILYGAISGEGGGIITALVYWILGQGLLIAAGLVYDRITPFSIHDEIEKDNVAAGVGFGGALAAMGCIIGLSGEGDFISWGDSLLDYIFYSLLGLVLLPVVRFLTDKVLLPGVSLSDEIANQETPNLGAAYFEAFAYVSAAFIVYWCV
jgi:uncharacterized membrane protein YjfL (UPF0719 family)